MNLRILPPEELLEGSITLPPSKSIWNRALIMRALTPQGAGSVTGGDPCDDTLSVEQALAQGPAAREVNVGAAGTAMRFLTAYYACTPGAEVTLDGSERMRRRPIGPLVEALRAAGASIEYAGAEGFPPLRITGRRMKGGAITIPASVSSQYISALLMTAPCMEQGLSITLQGEVASRPYILMTLGMMRRRGVEASFTGNVITIAPQSYRPVDCRVEGDWSAAAFWYETGIVSGGFLALHGLELPSLQGDAVALKLFGEIGIKTEPGEEGGLDLLPQPDPSPRFVADLSECPDLAQALIVTCALLGTPFRVSGLQSLRIKETDRIEALRRELLKIGTPVEVEGDSVMEWDGRRMPVTELPLFDTYDDHRMAMAFAPVALYIPGIIIRDAEVVSKSYPLFWEHLRSLGFTLLDADSDPA